MVLDISSISIIDVVEWLACIFSLLGSLLLALNNQHSRWGWLAFFVANIFWIIYGVTQINWPIVIQQFFFTITSVIGMMKWLVVPKNSLAER